MALTCSRCNCATSPSLRCSSPCKRCSRDAGGRSASYWTEASTRGGMQAHVQEQRILLHRMRTSRVGCLLQVHHASFDCLAACSERRRALLALAPTLLRVDQMRAQRRPSGHTRQIYLLPINHRVAFFEVLCNGSIPRLKCSNALPLRGQRRANGRRKICRRRTPRVHFTRSPPKT